MIASAIRRRIGGGNAAKAIDSSQFSGFGFRVTLQFAALDLEFALQQLGLRGHRHVFARRHREGTGDQTRKSGEHDDRWQRVRSGDPEDQRDVGEEPVADAEHGCSCRTALEIAVV